MLLAFGLQDLVHVDAALNGLATVLLVTGLLAVKRGAVALHKKCMLAAAVVSTLFLACYLTYHFTCPTVKFTGTGWIRWIYYPMLTSHIVLAVVQLPFIAGTIWLGLKDRRERHRRWARITAPMWLYVSVTGVLCYWLLYHW